MLGLSFEKLLLVGTIAAFLLGPERLGKAAAVLGRLVRELRSFSDRAKEQLEEELGPEFAEIEWSKLDPRRYDPRRIIGDALFGETVPGDTSVGEAQEADDSTARE